MKLPRDVNGRELVAALRKLRFDVCRQTGSHVQLHREGLHVTVPMHQPIRVGTLRSILRQAGLTPEELAELL